MFTKVISIFIILNFFSFTALSDADIDQWEDSDKTYNNLIDEGI